MSLNIAGNIIGGVKDIIDKTLDKIAGDKAPEETRLKYEDLKMRLSAELETNGAEMIANETKSFRSFILKYEGGAEDVPTAIVILRSVIRPLITIFFCALYGYGFVMPEKFNIEQMSMLKPMVLLCLFFWFGEKAVSRSGIVDVLKEKVKK